LTTIVQIQRTMRQYSVSLLGRITLPVGAVFHIDNCPPEIRRTPVSSVQSQSHTFTREEARWGRSVMGRSDEESKRHWYERHYMQRARPTCHSIPPEGHIGVIVSIREPINRVQVSTPNPKIYLMLCLIGHPWRRARKLHLSSVSLRPQSYKSGEASRPSTIACRYKW